MNARERFFCVNIFRWDDQQQINAVLETAKLLEKLSDELVATAHELASITSEERGGEKHQLAVERGEILRRDWAAKVCVHIPVSKPLLLYNLGSFSSDATTHSSH